MFIKRKSSGRRRPGQRSGYRSGYNSNNRSGGFRRNSGQGQRRNRFSERIDPALFVKKASGVSAPQIAVTHSFADFNFCDQINKNLAHKQFSAPTPIQDQCIPHILLGKDLVGLANTGTGKTAAFLLPLIDKVAANRSEKVLIIAPTRELAMQIEQEFRQFAWDMKIFSVSCVGGMSMYKQISNLKRDPNFVIGTPGRLKDLATRGLIRLNQFKTIVLDEVDRMLDMGFVEDIAELLNQLPAEKQSLFFTATLPTKIQKMISLFLNEPIIIKAKTGDTSANVDQDVVHVRNQELKFDQLAQLLRKDGLTKVLIFIETKAEVERLTSNLKQDGFKAESIHGDKKQHQRASALSAFKKNDIKILVATDVAARGLDIDNVSHVINYTVPQTYDDYVHRIGRTGRGTKKGIALTFIS